MDPAMQEQLLQQLRDIHAPAAIGWWPLAPGWWALLILVLASITAVCAWLIIRYKQDAYRRQALDVASHLYAEFKSDQNVAAYLGGISQLLRQLSLHIGKRTEIADVSGQAWIEQLNKHGLEPLSDHTAQALSEQIYRPNPDANIVEVHQEIYLWIRKHSKASHV